MAQGMAKPHGGCGEAARTCGGDERLFEDFLEFVAENLRDDGNDRDRDRKGR